MNIDINDIDPKLLEEDDRIVAYLKGKMTAEEELSFLKELESNPELKERAIIIARLVKGMKQVGSEQDKDTLGAFLKSSEENIESVVKQTYQISTDELIERAHRMEKAAVHLASVLGITLPETDNQMEAVTEIMDNIAAGYERKWSVAAAFSKSDDIEREKPASAKVDVSGEDITTTRQKKSKTIPLRRASSWLAAAASVIFIFWLGLTYNSYRNTTTLGDQYDDIFHSEKIVRGQETQTEAEKKLQRLFTNVKENQKIGDAMHELSLCWELSTMDTYNDYTDFSAEIGWYLAIAHLKNNDKKEAKAILDNLISATEKGSDINEKAKEIMEKL